MEKEIHREPALMRPPKTTIDESKLTPPQRKILEMARVKGVRMSRKLEDLFPDLGLTQEEADQFGRTMEELREESRREIDKVY